jgi:hypothetical protein
MCWRAIVALILVPAGLALLLVPSRSLLNVGPHPSVLFADTMTMDSDAKMIALRAEARSAMNALQATRSQNSTRIE